MEAVTTYLYLSSRHLARESKESNGWANFFDFNNIYSSLYFPNQWAIVGPINAP
jgi:hypothetical protein